MRFFDKLNPLSEKSERGDFFFVKGSDEVLWQRDQSK